MRQASADTATLSPLRRGEGISAAASGSYTAADQLMNLAKARGGPYLESQLQFFEALDNLPAGAQASDLYLDRVGLARQCLQQHPALVLQHLGRRDAGIPTPAHRLHARMQLL